MIYIAWNIKTIIQSNARGRTERIVDHETENLPMNGRRPRMWVLLFEYFRVRSIRDFFFFCTMCDRDVDESMATPLGNGRCPVVRRRQRRPRANCISLVIRKILQETISDNCRIEKLSMTDYHRILFNSCPLSREIHTISHRAV